MNDPNEFEGIDFRVKNIKRKAPVISLVSWTIACFCQLVTRFPPIQKLSHIKRAFARTSNEERCTKQDLGDR
jgi:hypothetical protein